MVHTHQIKVYFGRSKVRGSSVSAFYETPEIQRYDEVSAWLNIMFLAETFERENALETIPSQSRDIMPKQFWKPAKRSHMKAHVTLPTHSVKPCSQERRPILYRQLHFSINFSYYYQCIFVEHVAQKYTANCTHSNSFFTLCATINIAHMQTTVCRRWPHHMNGWAGLASYILILGTVM
jgi:hypothetical protein